MNKLNELIARCKGGITIFINDHKANYQTVKDYLAEEKAIEGISPDVLKRMIETDTTVSIQAYPDTPIGFYIVYHYDIEAAAAFLMDNIKAESN